MQAELIAIGNEVLEGFISNTNGAFIAKELLKNGFSVARQQAIGDDPKVIAETLNEAFLRADVVIVTGGLGPTGDDITRSCLASMFHTEIQFNEEAYQELIERYGDNFPSLADQAALPIKAKRIVNTCGTAFGMIFEENGKILIAMPGVPLEMKPMLLEQVIPFLKTKFSASCFHHRWLSFARLPESTIDPHLQKLKEETPDLCYGIYPSQGVVLVHLFIEKTKGSEELLDKKEKELNDAFQSRRFFSKNGRIEEAVHEKFLKESLTLSAAESCTGGAFSARLTSLSGASNYFLGSVVCYSNQMKIDLLGVSEDTLKLHGAVSEETVLEMLKGITKLTGSDAAVAVSGIAGPLGGSDIKPVGTVVLGAYQKGKGHKIKTLHFKGTRDVIIERSVNYLLSQLLFDLL